MHREDWDSLRGKPPLSMHMHRLACHPIRLFSKLVWFLEAYVAPQRSFIVSHSFHSIPLSALLELFPAALLHPFTQLCVTSDPNLLLLAERYRI